MKALAALLIGVFLVSCAKEPTIPKAILPPRVAVEQLNVAPVADAARKNEKAAGDVVKASRYTKAASDKVSSTSKEMFSALDRAEEYAKADEKLHAAYKEVQVLAKRLSSEVMDLTASNVILEEKAMFAEASAVFLRNEVHALEKKNEAQKVQLLANEISDTYLRSKLVELNELPTKLAASEARLEVAEADNKTLTGWVIGLGITCTVLLLGSIYLSLRLFIL